MADSTIPNGDLNALLIPYYQRAAEAEERLAKLEATKQGTGGVSELVRELQSKLEKVTAELASEQEKVGKLTDENAGCTMQVGKLADENAKKDYRIIHLVRSLRELQTHNRN